MCIFLMWAIADLRCAPPSKSLHAEWQLLKVNWSNGKRCKGAFHGEQTFHGNLQQSQHLSFCVGSLQKTSPRTKQGQLSNVWDLFHRHPFMDSMLLFFRHSHFFPATDLLHVSLNFSSVILCWVCIFQHDGCGLCFLFLVLTQNIQVPLFLWNVVHSFFEVHHQALFLFCSGNGHSSAFAFHASISALEVVLLFIVFRASVTFQHSGSFQFKHEAFSISLLPYPASFLSWHFT